MPNTEISLIQDSLKHLMKTKNVQYAGLASHLKVSTSTAKRLLNSEDPSLVQIIETCSWLGVSFQQLVEMASSRKQAYHFCSIEQEEFLAANLKHFAFLHHLQKGHSLTRIAADHDLPFADCRLYAQDLEYHGFISTNREGDIQLLVGDGLDWRADGPLRRTLLPKLTTGLFENYFRRQKHGAESFLDFGHKRLTKESYQQLKRDLDEISRKYGALTRIETELYGAQKTANYTYIMLFDEWVSELWKPGAYTAPQEQ